AVPAVPGATPAAADRQPARAGEKTFSGQLAHYCKRCQYTAFVLGRAGFNPRAPRGSAEPSAFFG
ncbi:MAG TPA: hypothetical protein VF395_14010, partial [Polyangiaceae bacterium]